MGDPNAIGEIRSLVAKLRRRVKIQRVVGSLTLAVTVQLMVVAALIALEHGNWMGAGRLVPAILATSVIPLLSAVAAWSRKIDPISLAQTLDRTHALHDRLSTALSLGDAPANAFELAQIRDAAKHIKDVDVRRAAPWERPAELGALFAAMGVVALVAWLELPDHRRPLPPEVEILHDKIMDDATLAMERERLEVLKQALDSAGLEDSQELVSELEELLKRAEDQKISEKEFLAELNRIEKKYLEKDDEGRADIAEKLREAAEKLEKEMGKELAKDAEAKALVDALKEKNYEKASAALDALAKKMQDPNISAKDLERMAKMMEKFADLIDPNDPALQKLIEQNQELVNKLQDLFDKKKLSDGEKKRLNDAKKRQQELEQKRRGNEGTLVSRQLKSLQKKTKDMAEKAQQAADQKKQQKGKNPPQEQKSNFQQEAGKKAEEAARQLEQEGKEQQKSEAREAAQKQLEELREAMQRSNVKREQNDQQSGEKGEKMKEFLDRAKGKKADEESGQKGDTSGEPGDGKPSSADKGDDAKTQKKGTGAGKGDSQGLGQGDRELGDETKLDGKRVDEKVDGKKGEGPSRSEVIRSASEEGFATTEYKDVYVDYESVVEEVMDKENVPKGYRFYIKRYFQLIRPQE